MHSQYSLLIQYFLWNRGVEWQTPATTNQSPCSWSLWYLSSSMLEEPLLFDLDWGDHGASSRNYVVPMGGTPILEWRPTLTMNLWYPDAINYELVLSFDVATVSTPMAVRGTGDVRLEDKLQIFGLALMEISFRPQRNLRSRSGILPSSSSRSSPREIRDLEIWRIVTETVIVWIECEEFPHPTLNALDSMIWWSCEQWSWNVIVNLWKTYKLEVDSLLVRWFKEVTRLDLKSWKL